MKAYLNLVLKEMMSDKLPVRTWPVYFDGEKLSVMPEHLAEALEAMRGIHNSFARLEMQDQDGKALRTKEHFDNLAGANKDDRLNS